MAFLDAKTGDLVTFWKAKADITDIVGAGAAARIFPEIARQPADAPFVVFSEATGGQSPRNLSGGCPIRFAQVNVWAYGPTKAAADALSEAVRLSIENYRGTMGATFVHDCAASAPDSGVDLPVDASDSKRYWTRVCYEIAHAVTAA